LLSLLLPKKNPAMRGNGGVNNIVGVPLAIFSGAPLFLTTTPISASAASVFTLLAVTHWHIPNLSTAQV
jgi:hypothetical protein